MKIEECKRYKVLPKPGTKVKTIINPNTELPVGKVMNRYIGNRVAGFGTYIDFVAGSSGDLWWIENDFNKSIGIYSTEEVFDI